jgi:hypothetical protein
LGPDVDATLLPSPADLEALFRLVIPSHPALQSVEISRSHILPAYLKSLLMSLHRRSGPDWPSLHVTLEDTPLSLESCRDLRHMLLQNVHEDEGDVGGLTIRNCNLTEQGWAVVLEGAAANRQLFGLHLEEKHVCVGPEVGRAAAAVLGPDSSLYAFELDAHSFSEQAFASILTALKTNTMLEVLTLRAQQPSHQGGGFRHLERLEQLVSTHNYSLSRIDLDPWNAGDAALKERIDELLDRNQFVRDFVQNEVDVEASQGRQGPGQRRSPYRIATRALWPRLLGEVGRFPSLLYKVLRQRENAYDFADQMTRRSKSGGGDINKKRKAPAASGGGGRSTKR